MTEHRVRCRSVTSSCCFVPPTLSTILGGAFMQGGKTLVIFHLSMNSVRLRPRFTEPTTGNKDVLMRNIRGGDEKMSSLL